MMELLDIQIPVPRLGCVETTVAGGQGRGPGKWLMGDDPRFPRMLDKPTLIDFFKLRLLLTSAAAITCCRARSAPRTSRTDAIPLYIGEVARPGGDGLTPGRASGGPHALGTAPGRPH